MATTSPPSTDTRPAVYGYLRTEDTDEGVVSSLRTDLRIFCAARDWLVGDGVLRPGQRRIRDRAAGVRRGARRLGPADEYRAGGAEPGAPVTGRNTVGLFGRGRHALGEWDEVLAWAWPHEAPDEQVNDAAEAATEVLSIRPVRDRAEDDTVPRLAAHYPWTATTPPPMEETGFRRTTFGRGDRI